jgi:hypothetical protein
LSVSAPAGLPPLPVDGPDSTCTSGIDFMSVLLSPSRRQTVNENVTV